MAKLPTIYVKELTFTRPEWADEKSEALTAYAQGYELEIAPAVESAKKWDWLVKVTSQISETPEVVANGTAASKSGAIWAAGLAANADQKRRAKAMANEPKPKADKTAGEMLAAVEAQVATEVEAKPRKRIRKETPTEEPVVVA